MNTSATLCLALGLLLSMTDDALAHSPAGDMQRADIRIDAPFFGAGVDRATLAPPPRPPSLVPVDEERSVTLPATMPSPCAAIATGNAIFYLSIQRLTALAELARQPVVTEKDTATGADVTGAGALLKKFTGMKDRNGCLTLATAPTRDEHYLLLGEIERGAVHALHRDSGLPIEAVSIRYLGEVRGPRVGWGTIFVRLPGRDTDELTLPWWIF